MSREIEPFGTRLNSGFVGLEHTLEKIGGVRTPQLPSGEHLAGWQLTPGCMPVLGSSSVAGVSDALFPTAL